MGAFRDLYSPPVNHTALAESTEYNVHRISINNTIVRYVEETSYLQVTIEGTLVDTIADLLINDVVEKLTRLEKAPCEAVEL